MVTAKRYDDPGYPDVVFSLGQASQRQIRRGTTKMFRHTEDGLEREIKYDSKISNFLKWPGRTFRFFRFLCFVANLLFFVFNVRNLLQDQVLYVGPDSPYRDFVVLLEFVVEFVPVTGSVDEEDFVLVDGPLRHAFG